MMETLKGIFPHIPPPPKRDFLRENVAKIKTVQPRRARKPSNQTEYSRFNNNNNNKPKKKFHGSSNSLSTCSRAPPMMNNLRKSMSTLSIQSRDFGVQTTDPDDEYFLKDSIIRYPSASTVRSAATSTHQLTCTRGHQLEQQRPQTPERPRRQLSEKMDRHLSNLSEFLDQGSIAKKSKSILKNSVKSNKNLINESKQKLDRTSGSVKGESKDDVIEFLDLTATDDVDDVMKDEEERKRKEALKLAEADPDCPEGHVPLLETERLEALKLAKHRFKDLIDELNRMPMTSETLRVRNRKIEIEKELKTIETNIRVFSKPKVYVKLN